MEERDYRQSRDRKGKAIPAHYEKDVRLADGRLFPIRVDFLAPEYGGTGRRHRHQKVQDLLAQKARGSDLVFDHFIEIEISGKLPNQAENRERIKIASPAPCLVMKAIAFGQRSSEKDAYDLYMLCDSLGVHEIVEQVLPLKNNKLVKEALMVLREKFSSPNAFAYPHLTFDCFSFNTLKMGKDTIDAGKRGISSSRVPAPFPAISGHSVVHFPKSKY